VGLVKSVNEKIELLEMKNRHNQCECVDGGTCELEDKREEWQASAFIQF